MRTTRGFVATLGASGSLVAFAAVALLVVSTIVAFRGWPDAGASVAPASLLVAAPLSPSQVATASRLARDRSRPLVLGARTSGARGPVESTPGRFSGGASGTPGPDAPSGTLAPGATGATDSRREPAGSSGSSGSASPSPSRSPTKTTLGARPPRGGDTVRKPSAAAGDAVGEATKDTGAAVGNAAPPVGNAIQEAGAAVDGAVKDTGRAVGGAADGLLRP